MKTSSDSSSAEFDYWFELNDLILEKVTEYYNSYGDSQKDRYENAKSFISSVESRLQKIEMSECHKADLITYTQELKLRELKELK